MNTSLLFKNAIINLYKAKIYTVDFAILKASDYADKNKINAKDYEDLLTYLAEEQEKEMQKDVADIDVGDIEENEAQDEAYDEAQDTNEESEE